MIQVPGTEVLSYFFALDQDRSRVDQIFIFGIEHDHLDFGYMNILIYI